MSGQLSGVYQASKNNTSNGATPRTPNVYSFPVTLVAGASVVLDLKTLANLHRIENVQGVFMDNSANSANLSIFTTAGQNLIIPGTWQGVFPLYLSPDATLTLAGNGTVNLTLLNFPTPVGAWPTSGIIIQANSGTQTVTDPAAEGFLQNLQSGIAYTSRSIVGTAVAASTQLMPANPARKYIYIQSAYNVAGVAWHDLWINPLGGTCSVGGQDCQIVVANTYYETNNRVTIGAVTYFDAVGGNNVTAFEG